MYPLASRPATLFRALRGRLWWQVVRLIQRLLVGSRGEVTALEQAIHLQERLLETAVKADLEEGFQGRVLDRLKAGGSVLERLDPLHPELLLAWQVDDSARPVAPFPLADDGPDGDPGVLVEGPYADARARAGAAATAEAKLALFSPVAAHASSRLARMLATLEVARAQEGAHAEEALEALDGLPRRRGGRAQLPNRPRAQLGEVSEPFPSNGSGPAQQGTAAEEEKGGARIPAIIVER